MLLIEGAQPMECAERDVGERHWEAAAKTMDLRGGDFFFFLPTNHPLPWFHVFFLRFCFLSYLPLTCQHSSSSALSADTSLWKNNYQNKSGEGEGTRWFTARLSLCVSTRTGKCPCLFVCVCVRVGRYIMQCVDVRWREQSSNDEGAADECLIALWCTNTAVTMILMIIGALMTTTIARPLSYALLHHLSHVKNGRRTHTDWVQSSLLSARRVPMCIYLLKLALIHFSIMTDVRTGLRCLLLSQRC